MGDLPINSLPELVLNQLRQPGDDVDFITYENDEQKIIKRSDFFIKCANLSVNLADQGVKAGDKVALIGPSGPLWLIIDLAIQLCGAISVPMFSNLPTKVAKEQIELANLEKAFWIGPPEYENFEPLIAHFKQVWLSSAERESDNIKPLDPLLHGKLQADLIHDIKDKCNQIKPEDLATIIFTSGSTAQPKGVMLSQNNLCSQILAAAERFDINSSHDKALSCLPLAHVFERMVTYFYLYKGISIYWVDDLQRVADRMKSSQPTIMTAVPRLLEKVYNAMSAKISSAPFPINLFGKAALSAAANHPVHAPKPWSFSLYNAIFYKKFRHAFGDHMNLMITGGAALPTHLATFFNNIGIPTYQGYGLSETSPVICVNFPGCNRIGSVGKTFKDLEVKINEENEEILTRGPHIMLGYYQQEDLTSEVIDQNGWFHTGDQGKIDEDGYLFITGRLKELYKTSNGKYVRPVPIETKICTHPWIDQAMVIADAKPYVTALFGFDEKVFEQLKSFTKINSEQLSEHLSHPEVKKQLNRHIDKINKTFHPWEQVRKFVWMPQALSAESGELTPTMKIKRHIVQNKYSNLIESMYTG